MKKYISIISILLVTFSVQAQQIVKPINLKDKVIYTSLFNSDGFSHVASVHLTKEQIAQTSNLEQRLELFIANVSEYDYDVLMTRDGNTAILKKYKTTAADVNDVVKINNQDKEVYFLSAPAKEYDLVKSKSLSNEEVHQSFNQIITTNINNEKELEFDALVVESDKVKYIIYK